MCCSRRAFISSRPSKRLEMNDLREQNIALKAELMYLRGIVDETSQANYRNLMKN